MQLTFDYEDIKEVFETMNITIHDVYFGSHATSSEVISTYMYWIGQADAFNYYQDPMPLTSLSLQIKGKWFDVDEIEENNIIGRDMVAWLKTQKYVNCRYFIDGTGSGTIGAENQDYLQWLLH